MGLEICKITDPVKRARIQRMVDNYLGAGGTSPAEPTLPTARPQPRIRQSAKPLMNKLETEFYHRIKDQYPNFPPVRVQGKTFRLANGLRYTPDFTCSLWAGHDTYSCETAWEVKGKQAWDDAMVKIKVAAHEWPEVQWILVWKNADGYWQEQRVLP